MHFLNDTSEVKMNLDKILKTKWTSPFNKKFAIYDGFLLTERYLELKKDFDGFEVQDDDIWVCSFPKCGTTWTQEMVWLIANNLDYEKAKLYLDQRFPFLEMSILGDANTIREKEKSSQAPKYMVDSLSVVKNLKAPRFIKTHLPFSLLPTQIKNREKSAKVIYVMRDPRDVCISFYHHSLIIDGFDITLDEYYNLFLAGKIPFGPFWNHVFSYWNVRNNPNLLFLRYEDMKNDLKQVIKQVAVFLNRHLNDKEIKQLSEHLSFDSMKSNTAVNKEKTLGYFKNHNDDKKKGSFMRKGIVGDYKNKMDQETIDKFNEWIETNLQGTDFKL